MESQVKYCGTCGAIMVRFTNGSAINYICPVCNPNHGSIPVNKTEPMIEENSYPSGKILLENS